MLVQLPEKTEVKVTHHVCSFHEKHPGKPYAGCTCGGSFSLKRKDSA